MNWTIVDYVSQFELYQTAQAMLASVTSMEMAAGLLTLLVFGLGAFVIANVMAIVGGLGTYAERKVSADLQARQGPNRVGPFGLLQFLADGVKMITKEDISPKGSDKLMFYLAPAFCMAGVFATLAIVPFSSSLALTHLNVGVFFMAAVSSIVGIGVFLGGYASNSKWSLLGAMRAASQIISYEIPLGITMLSVVLLAGSLNFKEIIEAQGSSPLAWYAFHNPFTFVGVFIFFWSTLAETNRAPFDLPEAESELVSGYHTEYTGIRFGLFALAEYIEIFVVCGVTVALFLGGYNVPLKIGGTAPLGQLLQLGIFVGKVLALYYVVIWIRWTLPRLRVDQLMSMCWKYFTPIAIFNLVGTLFWLYYFDGKSVYQLVKAFAAASAGGGH